MHVLRIVTAIAALGALWSTESATYTPPGRRFEQLVADADSALYRAKREGRNRVALC